MTTIRWGIIGCGDVCEVKSGPGLYKARDSALVAVMRRDGAKAADFARRHGVARSYDDADALIGDRDVDAVYVATPPDSHKDYTLRAAAAGKHVLVEKPMALSVAECEAMVAGCRDAGVNLYVAYYRRALPRFEALRRLVQDGTLGSIRLVLVRHLWSPEQVPGSAWRVDPAINGGGIFVDTQSHTLDWLDHVFGPPRRVSGAALNQSGRSAAEDAVGAVLTYPGDVLASFACAYAADSFEDSVTIIGDRGRARMGFLGPSPITLESTAGTRTIDLQDPPHVHQPFVQQVVDHLNGGALPAGQPEAGVRVNRALAQILVSH
ncbi:MAG: Gfo/Idh/MocA family protein [Alphaproteobacteria bacterium]